MTLSDWHGFGPARNEAASTHVCQPTAHLCWPQTRLHTRQPVPAQTASLILGKRQLLPGLLWRIARGRQLRHRFVGREGK